MKYANVIIENKSRHTDNFFTYLADDSVQVGDKVMVPFGPKDREKEGFVFGFADEPDCPADKLKSIVRVCQEQSLTEEIISTAGWMKQRYAIKYYDAVKCFIAAGKPAKEGREKEPYKGIKGNYTVPEALTGEQTAAVEKICGAIDSGRQENFLIHGVTASGKTQVYMEAIDRCLELGRTAIMLVPEISLTSQIIERFAGRFGKEQIAVMHSRLTPRERYDEWQRIRSGRAKIVIGARMGVFAPLENIGIIVMDEEHEATYKADMTPKYDTVEVALKRLKYYNGVLVLGSATPSVTSYQRCHEGIYTLIELKERYNKTPLPKVHIADMREELREGNNTIFSRYLFGAMKQALEKGQQVILLQNRRGYSNFVSCRECGKVMKCPECGISLTYHKSGDNMVCHYCGRSFPVPKTCPECSSRYVKFFGIGTEQVEEAVKEYFPDAVVGRLDLDSVKKRTDLDKILKAFADKKTDILVGTQLVAKGLDFDNVGVVGVIAADVTLNIPDYRSAERTFQLVTQVAGRAGRGGEQGLVVVQTYEPQNYAIRSAANHDYQSFFSEETGLRQFMDYPPFGDIIMVNFTSEDETVAMASAERCKVYMERALKQAASEGCKEAGEGKVLSPKISGHFRGEGSFRYYIIVKCPKGQRSRYVFYLDNFSRILLKEKTDCVVNIDVNPYSFI
ncbi:MAG: primosomal protein N' [Firmicutes bacterium]|nr:primosomal protein N' [Bacillota bacterium]